MSIRGLLGGVFAKLEGAGLYPETLRAAALLMWRAILLGSALFLMLGEDPEANFKLNGVSYVAALIWSYYDGVFAKRKWSTAWLEAIFLQLAGVQVGNILVAAFEILQFEA